MEEGVSSEDHSLLTILHKPTYAVLCMTWRVQSLHLNIANLEGGAILGGPCNTVAVLTADYGLFITKFFELT